MMIFVQHAESQYKPCRGDRFGASANQTDTVNGLMTDRHDLHSMMVCVISDHQPTELLGRFYCNIRVIRSVLIGL